MAVDRDAWPETATDSTFPKWPCPNCGHTISIEKDGIAGPETGASGSWHGHEAWEPEWIEGRFVASYSCSHCEDPAFVIGTYTLREGAWDAHRADREYFPVYCIRSIEPPPVLIGLPDSLPDELTAQLERAFRLFWIDGSACANAIRGVVEVFLNHKRVRKTDGSGRKKSRLTLHQRIELFAEKDAHLSAALMAVKWIGNVGSHATEVPRETLFDGFDLLEHVLEEALDSPRLRAARLARTINRRKGATTAR